MRLMDDGLVNRLYERANTRQAENTEVVQACMK